MSEDAVGREEAILLALADGKPVGSRALAVRLGTNDRRIRRGLRRLLQDGHVFSPAHGVYRITALGAAVLIPIPESLPAESSGERWWRRR